MKYTSDLNGELIASFHHQNGTILLTKPCEYELLFLPAIDDISIFNVMIASCIPLFTKSFNKAVPQFRAACKALREGTQIVYRTKK